MFTETTNVYMTPEVQEPVTPIPELDTTTDEPEMLEGVVANCVKLNVRNAPNANAPVVCTIPRGTEVEVIEEESTDEFYKVYTASGIEGFCMKQYVTVEP